jgi:hypothetical protein
VFIIAVGQSFRPHLASQLQVRHQVRLIPQNTSEGWHHELEYNANQWLASTAALTTVACNLSRVERVTVHTLQTQHVKFCAAFL